MTARVLAVLFVFLLTLVASASTSPAQVVAPTAPGAPLTSAFTYQGSLLSGGAAASGAFDFQCILYDAASGGSQVARS